jgi:hypothetical protein
VLGLGAVASGCSSSASPGTAATRQPVTSPTPTQASLPAADAAALRAVTVARRLMAAVPSYRFLAREQLVAASTLRSTLAGRVVRGEGLAYELTIGRKRTQVVRLRNATYVRAVPRRWSRLRHPRRLTNPTDTLLRVLAGLRPTSMSSVHGSRVVHGVLPATTARSAGLPASAPAQVTVTLDAAGHVTALDVRTTTTAAGHPVGVRLQTSYRAFGHVAAIRRPA